MSPPNGREQHFRIDSPREGLRLFLRRLPPASAATGNGKAVLYVHGATFPSALSIAYPLDGRSWADDLAAAGFDCWGLDFHGFGRLSDPYPEMAAPAENRAALGTAEEESRQLEAAVRFIRAHRGVARVSLIAHSRGTMVAGRFAGRCPELVERMVMFAPIARREPNAGADAAPRLPAWRLVPLQYQFERFVADVPPGAPSVFAERHLHEWGEAYLDCDPESRGRSPPAVKIPTGALQDIADAWAGRLAYEPGLIRCPVAIVRGAWDSLCTDADAKRLFDALSGAPMRRDIKIDRATHLMHLEERRFALYRETRAFLDGGDGPVEA